LEDNATLKVAKEKYEILEPLTLQI